MASAGAESAWRGRPFDCSHATGAAGRNRSDRSSVAASGFPGSDRETGSERGSESGGSRVARGTTLERAKTGGEGTRSKGWATDPRTFSGERQVEKGDCRTR